MRNEILDSTLDATREPSEAVVTAVAQREGVAPTEVPPLYGAVDPDALDRLFDGREPGRVSFDYAGYEVTVRGPGRISIDQRDP